MLYIYVSTGSIETVVGKAFESLLMKNISYVAIGKKNKNKTKKLTFIIIIVSFFSMFSKH